MSRAIINERSVEIKGLDELLNWLAHANPKLEKALKKGLKDSMNPVLQKARANANVIAYQGQRRPDKTSFHDSLSIVSRSGGSYYVLKSTDPAAGVKEFAHEGATRLVGKSAKSSTQRARKYAAHRAGKKFEAPGLREVRVGVPHRANPPRVMLPALDSSADEVRGRIDDLIVKVLKEAQDGKGR